jgi:hypothetical protein
MDYQTRGFVDDGQMLVLEDEREWYGARLERARWFVLGKADGDRLTPREQPGGAGWFAIDADELVGDQASGLSAGDGELICQKAV